MFEFDPNKSQSNLEEHDIDFIEAQKLWADRDLIELEVVVEEGSEQRYLNIGKLKGKYWTAVTTYRGNNIRIISVRRSRKMEVRFYES